MIARGELIRALGASRVADWIVIERAQAIAVVDDVRGVVRRERRTLFTVVVHHDAFSGRGSATLTIAGTEGDATAVVGRAIALAAASVGQPWKSVPPSAPARVDVVDPELAQDPAALEAVAGALAARIRTSASEAAAEALPAVRVMREQVMVNARSGFATRFAASERRAEAIVAASQRTVDVVRAARRGPDLELEAAVTAAARTAKQLAGARPVTPGRVDLVLGADVLLHGGGLGLWQVFAAQADAADERRGITRYRLAVPVAEGAAAVEEPLSITSDGAIDFALRSAPVGDEGDAIRRFPLVEGGVAVGLGLSVREAALRDREPNGGVRNLVVAPGTWDPARHVPRGGRMLEARHLRGLALDPLTGHASLDLALAIEQPGAIAVTGASVRLDLVAALARGKRSADMITRGPYLGPTAVLIEGVEVAPW